MYIFGVHVGTLEQYEILLKTGVKCSAQSFMHISKSFWNPANVIGQVINILMYHWSVYLSHRKLHVHALGQNKQEMHKYKHFSSFLELFQS